ncbi:DUF3298/DUF4163 domain-containing protein [Helicobacter sp. MIT 05-5293]|uniref:DUF3298 and DUF4163 domain-containing protein n=1 Tax=Helicobacter sp. MIT 05-5293 TaxID=1548149 RepID=UPI00051D35CD|nr:DUF3298 and DUF4163 domain-containing protein [Helicobacter sp. MIT 05-5293]TLD82089.1 DUF3298/DUF4163 domain-containing protein [Helicobacter sp. MIT 05-5293]
MSLFLTIRNIGLGICLGLAFVACGDSKDSESTAIEIEKLEKQAPQARDSHYVRELLGIEKETSIFYLLKGKVGGKEQIGYLLIEEHKPIAGIESDTEEIVIDSDDGEDSQPLPLYVYIVLPNVWNEELDHYEFLSIPIDSQKLFITKDEKGRLKISGEWKSELGSEFNNKDWEQKSRMKGKTFIFTQDDTMPLREVSFVNVKETQSLENPTQEDLPISFNSSYTRPIILASKNPMLDSKVLEKLNEQFAEGAKDTSELANKLALLTQKDFKKFQAEKYIVDTEYVNSYGVEFIDSRILSLQVFNYIYGGGAHGVYSTEMESYSLETGERLSNDIGDLLRLDGTNKDALLQILTQKLETPFYKELLFDEVLPLKALPHNFFITSQGIHFLWRLYEIAPYVAGEIDVMVGFEELKPFVNPNSPYAYLFGL